MSFSLISSLLFESRLSSFAATLVGSSTWYGVAKIVAAFSETARPSPRLSRMLPRIPGTVAVAVCCERASAENSPPLTVCSQAARRSTPQNAIAKRAKRRPTLRSISFTPRAPSSDQGVVVVVAEARVEGSIGAPVAASIGAPFAS